MIDREQLNRDLQIVKALCYMEDTGIRWYRCILLGTNELGQFHVRRIRTGEDAIATKISNLTDKDRAYLRNNYL